MDPPSRARRTDIPRRRRLGGVIGLLACLVGPAALAGPARQARPSDLPSDLTTLSLEELMDVEVVYAASRYEQTSLAAPADVTVITADEIRAYGYRTLADILNGVRGLYVTYDRNYSYVGVRGFGRPGDYNSRLLVLIDGYRINDNVYDAALVGPEFSLDVDLIQRVEVVRGPGSSLYGTSAVFGVVNIITKRAKDLPGLRAAASVASWSTIEAQVDYGHTWEGGRSLLVSGSGWDSGGQNLFYPEFDDPATNDGVAEDADYESGGRLRAVAAAGAWSFDVLHGSREKGIPTGSFGTVFNDPRTRTVDEQTYAAATWSRRVAGEVDIEAHLAYNRYSYRGRYVQDYGTPGNPLPVVNNDKALGEWWTADIQATRRFGPRQRLTGGAEYRLNTRQQQTNYDLAVYLDDDRRSDILGLYVEDEIGLGREVTLYLGLRHDHYDTFGSTTNPRLALVWIPAPRTALKFLGGRAFRAPNAYELYYDDGGLSQKGNPLLDPESINTYEVVCERLVTERVLLTGAAYAYRISDLVTQTVDPSDGLIVFRNLDEVRARGIEFELDGRLAHGVRTRFSWSAQWSEDVESGDTLSNSPRHLAKLHVDIPARGGRLTTGLEFLYVSERQTLQATTAAEHLLMNLTVTGRLLDGRMELQGSIYNLPDVDYADPGSGEHIQATIDQDGRSYRAVLRYKF
jgi:iron complex outermembrane receptor protein